MIVETGDYVKVKLVKEEYLGILLEAPKDEKGIILLKLDSGYNIGLDRKKILNIKVLRKAKEEKEEKISIKKQADKPNVAMILTGGTISSTLDVKTGAVKWLTSPEKLFQFYPDLFKHVNILKVEVPFMKGSENMSYNDWRKISKVAVKLLNDDNVKGLIISHGTDFLHYTSAALSFFLRNLNKPVVLTYSQRSSDRASSDASLNLECSAIASVSDIAEVMLVGHASDNDDFCYAMPGTKVRKLHSSRRDAFKVVNTTPFAKISPGYIAKISDYKTRSQVKGKVKLDDKFEEKIALVKFYPGMNPSILDYYIKNKYKGLVIEVSGLGHLAIGKEARYNLLPKIKEAISKGIIVCAAPQTIYGRLDPLVYSPGRELLNAGIIFLEDMLAETALIKLGWVLGHKEWAKSKEIVKEKMLENFSHEINDRLEE
ncbi:MAG: Glu-tRNA(Gln) amidotransferase subunit GatD [Nanoarchaeota archaeon]|nr:Glu-tRNA(Gln) amidotransferase subunit GatD [Nanoarchaeota archaeon]